MKARAEPLTITPIFSASGVLICFILQNVFSTVSTYKKDYHNCFCLWQSMKNAQDYVVAFFFFRHANTAVPLTSDYTAISIISSQVHI